MAHDSKNPGYATDDNNFVLDHIDDYRHNYFEIVVDHKIYCDYVVVDDYFERVIDVVVVVVVVVLLHQLLVNNH
jgi:hypothetical protein